MRAGLAPGPLAAVIASGILATLVLLLLGVALWAALLYNRLVAQVREAWSDIQVQLRRRYDLIPNLAATVRARDAHERATIESAIRAREAALADTGEGRDRFSGARLGVLRGAVSSRLRRVATPPASSGGSGGGGRSSGGGRGGGGGGGW